jgi:hypothetical protein
MRIHQKFTIMEQNVLSADLIYIWDKTISKRIVENIEKLKEEKDVELNLLKAR